MAYENLTPAQEKEIYNALGVGFGSAEKLAFLKGVDLAIGAISVSDLVGTISGATVSPATPTVTGVVKQGVAVDDITPDEDGTTAGTALNDLLASLRAAGVLAASEE